jgi:hypothetical protein
MFVYVGLAVNPSWINDVFGVQTAAQINVEKPKLEERDNPTSRQVRKIVDLILKERQRTHLKLVSILYYKTFFSSVTDKEANKALCKEGHLCLLANMKLVRDIIKINLVSQGAH